ncbi:hypothetical protein TSUD_196000 [Trifolium subterraneum]|nr:hypothetical protein TSUD_196000 [Trifolium subterraneum]
MAEEQAPASTSNTDGDDYAWVADEPRTTVSKFSLNGGEGMFRTVQHSSTDDWKACIPNTNRRICSKFQWGSFPMYQIAFEQMGYRLPFSDFEVAVFRYLHLTPSQLHPNSLAFIRAFEMTASYLGFMPTIPLFFHAFHLQRSRPKGDAANKFGWVSLKQSTKLFEMFLESVRGFKDSYFFIKPLNSVSWQSIIYRGPAKDATGAPLIGPDGRPILEDYSRFPLSWRKSHYLKPASDFIYSTEELTVEELSNYEQMKVFVGSFPRKTYEDEDGNVVLDNSGAPLTKKCFIDTRRLLACKSSAEMEACFRDMSSIAAKLRKSKAAKEKRQAARGPRCLSSSLLGDSLLGECRALPPRAAAPPLLGGDRLFLRGGERLAGLSAFRRGAGLGDLDLDRERLFTGVGDLCRRVLRDALEAARDSSTARSRLFCSRISSFCPRMLFACSRSISPCLLIVLTNAAITTSMGAPCGTCGTTNGSSGCGGCGGGTSSGVACACAALPSDGGNFKFPTDGATDLYLDQSRPDAGARLFVMSSSPNIPGGGLCTCRCSDAQNAGEMIAAQWSSEPGPHALGLARRPKVDVLNALGI